MTEYSLDVIYAYAQLGLEAGASREQIESVRTNAVAYRFSTRERVKQVERFVEFFAARGKLGRPQDSFADIRKAYHKQALAFHPDRHLGNKRAEEELKIINAAFAIVDDIHREARDYFKQSEAARRDIEAEARRAAAQEAPARPKAYEEPAAGQSEQTEYAENAGKKSQRKETAARAAQAARTGFAASAGRKYLAASIPRFMRTARLSHLRLDCVIGCWFIKRKDDINLIYDVIMLPEREFMRMRAHLGTPNIMTPVLQRGGVTPSYVPQDVKEVNVPPGETDPENFAKNYFLQEFGMENKIVT